MKIFHIHFYDRFMFWLAARVPKSLAYYVIAMIAGRCKHQGFPGDATVSELLEYLRASNV
ncbi:MAG TPA: hypothetical protein V6C76_11670 [Drouetiella sp.]